MKRFIEWLASRTYGQIIRFLIPLVLVYMSLLRVYWHMDASPLIAALLIVIFVELKK